MLVLTRKPNQQLHIGNDIVITVVKVRGNTIRLGIEAPKDVRVIRSELEPKADLEAKSSSGGIAKSDAEAGSAAAQSDGQPEADVAGPADDAPEVVADACASSAATVIFEARIKQPAGNCSPLKRFTDVKRAQGALSQRNLEDSPLCHCDSQASAPALRSSGLHNYIALKNRSGRLVEHAPRDQYAKSQDAPTAQACTKQACSSRALSVQA